MARIANPHNLDDDDDAVFSGLLSQGAIWLEDDDEDATPYKSDIDELDTRDEIVIQKLAGYQGEICCIATAGEYVFASSSENTLTIWNWHTGKLIRTLRNFSADVTDMVVSGDFAIVATPDKTLQVLKWKTGRLVRSLQLGDHSVERMCLHEQTVAAEMFGAVWLWNWQTGEILRKFSAAQLRVAQLGGLYKDLLLTSSDEQGTVRNWNTGNVIFQVVATSALGIAGEFIFDVDYERVREVWNWTTGKRIEEIQALSGGSALTKPLVLDAFYNIHVYQPTQKRWSRYNNDPGTISVIGAIWTNDHSHFFIEGDGVIEVRQPASSLRNLLTNL